MNNSTRALPEIEVEEYVGIAGSARRARAMLHACLPSPSVPRGGSSPARTARFPCSRRSSSPWRSSAWSSRSGSATAPTRRRPRSRPARRRRWRAICRRSSRRCGSRSTPPARGTARSASRASRACAPAECSFKMDRETSVTIIARAAAASKFVTWTGACGGERICSIYMDRSRSVTALFTRPTAGPRRGRHPIAPTASTTTPTASPTTPIPSASPARPKPATGAIRRLTAPSMTRPRRPADRAAPDGATAGRRAAARGRTAAGRAATAAGTGARRAAAVDSAQAGDGAVLAACAITWAS